MTSITTPEGTAESGALRVVVTGLSGNAGTALLRALRAEPAIGSVLGIARRLPDRTAEPYRAAEWAALDLTGEEDAVVEELTRLFRGADAVVHLAWLIQPNRDRELLRTANVEGTRRVARAVAEAGVPHLVVASSVGAYAPVDDDEPRDESWPTDGISTSHYSVDKAAQEAVLDELERDRPDVIVTRVRPSLVFQADAGAEIPRLFLGPLIPVRLLRHGRLPALTVPAGLRLQAVHSDDLADAYRLALLRRPRGAVNVAAPDVLRAQDLARIVGNDRLVEVPPGVVRAALALAYDTHLVVADPGWLDMAMGAPLLDTTRATEELGWTPRRTAAEALEELLQGMGQGQGVPSGPLHPASTPALGEEALPRRARHVSVPPTLDSELLGLYLSDHLTGATAGLGRIERMAEAYQDLPLHGELAELAEQVRGERDLYRVLLDYLHLPRRRHRQLLSGVAERIGRLKLNGRVVERSPLTVLLEAELMRSALVGKQAGWQTIADHAEELGLDPDRFVALVERTDHQIETIERLHAYARARAFREQD